MADKNINKEQFETVVFEKEKVSGKVVAEDLTGFDDNEQILRKMIMKRKLQYQSENKMTSTSAYESLEELCQINVDTLKKTISSKLKITRNFLYKFAVGLHMSLVEANKYFELNGGALQETCLADYICICALRDRDEIGDFIHDFELHTELKIAMRVRQSK